MFLFMTKEFFFIKNVLLSPTQMYIQKLQALYNWLDTQAASHSHADVVDTVRVRVLELIQDFVAFPHCESFSLMCQPSLAAPPAPSRPP